MGKVQVCGIGRRVVCIVLRIRITRTDVGAYVLKYEVLASVYPITYEMSA